MTYGKWQAKREIWLTNARAEFIAQAPHFVGSPIEIIENGKVYVYQDGYDALEFPEATVTPWKGR